MLSLRCAFLVRAWSLKNAWSASLIYKVMKCRPLVFSQVHLSYKFFLTLNFKLINIDEKFSILQLICYQLPLGQIVLILGLKKMPLQNANPFSLRGCPFIWNVEATQWNYPVRARMSLGDPLS